MAATVGAEAGFPGAMEEGNGSLEAVALVAVLEDAGAEELVVVVVVVECFVWLVAAMRL